MKFWKFWKFRKFRDLAIKDTEKERITDGKMIAELLLNSLTEPNCDFAVADLMLSHEHCQIVHVLRVAFERNAIHFQKNKRTG